MPRTLLPRTSSRRDLLRGAAGLGALAAFGAPLLRRPARGSPGLQDRYYIFCYFMGGWDLLLSLDPRDPATFREDLKKTTRIQPGLEYLDSAYQELVTTSVDGMVFGPCIGRLADHADKLCVVRGMSMETLTHEVGRRRFLTGRAPAGLQAQGSSLPTILATELGQSQALPQLSVLVESYNDGFPSYASAIRVSSVDDLVRALQPNPVSLEEEAQAAVDALMRQAADCAGTQRSDVWREAMEYREASKALVTLGLDSAFDFAADTAEMEEVRDRYGIDPEDLSSPEAQAATAVRAITSGISRCVSIRAGENLDTHGPEWATAHGPRLESGFDVVAAMIEELAETEYQDSGESWLDRTTIIGFSEFGRSPLLNSSGGRDHYLHNACFLAGGGVRGGRVIGESSDTGMAPTTTDLSTGEPSDDGEVVKPEHIYRAVLVSAGIEEDLGEYEVEPLTAIYG